MKVLIWIKEFFSHPLIQLALVSGASIIALAYVSKRVLPEPMKNLYVSLPPLLVALAGGLMGTKKNAWYTNRYLWLVAVAMTTILIITIHLARY